MSNSDALLTDGGHSLLRPYQALLFRGLVDRTLGPWRLVYTGTQSGMPTARSLIDLDNAWHVLVWQHNLMLKPRDLPTHEVTMQNWREHNLLLTPVDWFETRDHRWHGRRSPEAFTFCPAMVDEIELSRWKTTANRR